MASVDPTLPDPSRSHGRRRLEILTGLRFVAAFAVFAGHVLPVASAAGMADPDFVFRASHASGAMGVSFFFILSGFVITWSGATDPGARVFYWRRLARIVPVYWVVLGGLILLGVARGVDTSPTQALAALALVQSWIPDSGYYFAVTPVAWSLSVEMLFYAASPLLVPALHRLGPRARSVLLVGLLGAATVLAILLPHSGFEGTNAWLNYIFPPTRVVEFALGCLLAIEIASGRWRGARLGWAVPLAGAAFVVGIFTPLALTKTTVVAVPFMILIGAAARAELEGARSILATPAMVALGTWSYCFYLVHLQVIREVDRIVAPDGEWATIALVAAGSLTVAVGVSAALYRTVERPVELRLRHWHRVAPDRAPLHRR